MSDPRELLRSVLKSGGAFPGPTYRGIWARDTGQMVLGLIALGEHDAACRLLTRAWDTQITRETDPDSIICLHKDVLEWRPELATRGTPELVAQERGAFPTAVYVDVPGYASGTLEIYTDRADPDSVAWLVVALGEYVRRTGDRAVAERYRVSLDGALRYLLTREEADLLMQGPNQDWADTLHRRGAVTYTQAVWCRALEAAGAIYRTVELEATAGWCSAKREAARVAMGRHLLRDGRSFPSWRSGDEICERLSLDTALAVAFDLLPPAASLRVLKGLDALSSPFGHRIVWPPYAHTAPADYPVGQYHNAGSWPWLTGWLALAWAELGEPAFACDLVSSAVSWDEATVHEWIDTETGERHHPSFVTGAATLAWAYQTAMARIEGAAA